MRSPVRPPGSARVGAPAVYYVLSSEQFTTRQLIEYGAEAERAGFDGVWTSDHFQPWQANEGHAAPAWVTLAGLTQRTSRIAMGTGVTCPTFRYRPAIVAQTWAALSSLAPGRVFLGLGTGEKLNEAAAGGGWGSYEERADRLVEAIRIIRSLWTGNRVRMKGKFWKVDGKLYDPPASPIPIYVAAGGEKSARLAGIHGDGMITAAGTLRWNPAMKMAWEKARREAGRQSSEKRIMVEHWAIPGGDEEAVDAARKWRFLPRAWDHGFFDSVSPEEIEGRSEKKIGLDEVLKDWSVSLDPRAHIQGIRELADLGATHVAIHVPTPNQVEAINFFGREVLPGLQMSASVA